MKKIVLVLALALIVSSAFIAGNVFDIGAVSAAQLGEQMTEQLNSQVVVVRGEATITVQPDIAKINLSVLTNNVDSKVAQADNKRIMSDVLQALEKAGVAKDDMTTSHYNIYQAYDDSMYPAKDEKRVRVYHVSNGITIKTTKIDEVGKLIDVATAAGANDIDGIDFESSKAEEYYQEALKKAMASAKQKANAITSTFGKTVDVPLRVLEVSRGGAFNRNVYAAKMMDGAGETPIQAGGLKISATLTVEYAY